MDNEAIVEQIVRNLSFEVVAVPQDVVQINSTSRSTPLNVKIRVRKKKDAELHHGVLSMPKVEQKEKRPKRIRLVSSDTTIMSFNVVMEADFDKVPSIHEKQNLQMVTSGRVQDKMDPTLSKKADTDTSTILSKRNRDIFGKCKPGGCLDPPFGEEKYSYQPTQKNISVPIKDDTTKLRNSSIFKNTLFKRKKKCSQDDELYKNDKKASTEAGSIINLYEKGSLQSPITYSNSIITYPHQSNSSDLRAQEKSNKIRYSSEEKSRCSVLEDNGSYFIIPKKAKKQIDSVEIPQTENLKLSDDTLKHEHKNILRTMPETDGNLIPLQSETDESKRSLPVPNFNPIPLLAVIKDKKKDLFKNLDENTYENILNAEELIGNTKTDKNNEVETEIETKSHIKVWTLNDKVSSLTDDQNQPVQMKSSDTDIHFANAPAEKFVTKVTPTLLGTKILNSTNDASDTSNKEGNYIKEDSDIVTMTESTINEFFAEGIDILDKTKLSDTQTAKHISQQDHLTESTLLHKIPDVENAKSNIDLARLSSTIQNVIPITIKDIDKILDDNNSLVVDTGDYEDILDVDNGMEINTKSLLVADRDKSVLDIAAGVSHSQTSPQHAIEIPKVSANEGNYKEDSTKDLKHLWLNENEPLKSVADVITKDTLPASQGKKISTILEKYHFSVDESNKNDLKLESSLQSTRKSGDNYLLPLENEMNQKDEKVTRKTIPLSESENEKVNLLGTYVNESKRVSVTKGESYKGIEKLQIKDKNNDDCKSPKILNKLCTSDDSNNIITRNDLTTDVSLPENIDGIKLSDLTNIENMSEILKKADFPRDSIKHQKTIIDQFDKGYIKSNIQEDLEVTTLTSITEEKNTIKDLLPPVPNAIFKSNLGGEVIKTDKVECIIDKQESSTAGPYFFTDKIEPELTMQYQDKIGHSGISHFGLEQLLEHDVSEVLHKTLQPTTKLQQGIEPWKMDIGLQSYISENKERVIKSFDTDNIPGRRQNDTVVVAQCYLEDSDAEDMVYHEDLNMSEANKHTKMISDDIQDILTAIYEQELVPLQKNIQGLREEIDMLATYQMTLREKVVQELGSKKPKPLRLVHSNKKCACVRRL